MRKKPDWDFGNDTKKIQITALQVAHHEHSSPVLQLFHVMDTEFSKDEGVDWFFRTKSYLKSKFYKLNPVCLPSDSINGTLDSYQEIL